MYRKVILIYIYILFHIHFHFGLLHDSEHSFLLKLEEQE